MSTVLIDHYTSESASVVPESYDPKIIVSQTYASVLGKSKSSKLDTKTSVAKFKPASVGGAPGVDEDQTQTAIIKTYSINY